MKQAIAAAIEGKHVIYATLGHADYYMDLAAYLLGDAPLKWTLNRTARSLAFDGAGQIKFEPWCDRRKIEERAQGLRAEFVWDHAIADNVRHPLDAPSPASRRRARAKHQ